MILFFFKETPFVRGYNRTCIYDLPKHRYDFIPNDFMDKIKSFEHFEKDVIYNLLDSDEIEWLTFLLDKEYCFFADKNFIDCFPDINLNWKSSSKITNAIIDFDNSKAKFDFKILESLNCKHILIRFTKKFPTDLILSLLNESLNNITFKSVDIQIEKKEPSKFYLSLKKLIIKQISQVTKFDLINSFSINKNLKFKPKFVLGIDTFAESQKHNLFFNKKAYFTSNNYIKNGIEPNKKFLHKNKLEDIIKIINLKRFKNLWNVNKDKIDVCKDCEFRYMCVDNRLPLKRKNVEEYYFENPCSYNPYISLWDNHENYLSLKDINIISNNSSFVINNEFISSINEKLWD